MPLIPETTNLGPVKPNVAAINREVILAAEQANPGRKVTRVWGYNAASVPEHSAGTALDFMVYSDRVLGDWIANYLWDNRVRLGLRWEIWQQRIRSTSAGKPTTWVAMADRGSVTQNHMDHIHANFWEKAYVAPANAPQEDDLDMWDRAALFDVINSATIGVFRSEEAKAIMRQEAINALNLPLDRGGLPEEYGDTSVLAVASWSDANLDSIRKAISAVDAKADATLAAVSQIANDPDITVDQLKAAVQEAVANSVEVSGTLTVSKRPETPVVEVPQDSPQS